MSLQNYGNRLKAFSYLIRDARKQQIRSPDMAKLIASELRKTFRAIPKEQRNSNDSFSIRVWRAMSWLERAEQAGEVEDQFIALWIAFNALYGRLDDHNRAWGDREAMDAFLSRIWDLDDEGRFRQVLGKRQLVVLKLVESKYLYNKFWSAPGSNHEHKLHEIVRDFLPRFGTNRMLPVFRTLFDRLYVMRNQVFHGASTKGSSLNRRTLTQSTGLLADLLPLMVKIMLEKGIEEDWGEVCFPPVE